MALDSSFLRYACVGVANTLLHASAFFALVYLAQAGQALANTVAFLFAATFSYLANSIYTFDAPRSRRGYLLFVGFMGGLAWGTGYLAQGAQWAPLITLVVFSLLSLCLGYGFSRFVIFRARGNAC
ncbi:MULTISPECIES: GtrA family protein [unclassified Pseudomonas]|uniref:GtrA family protein n=1 Tax=unclassified Pseudomonas TaxID=196821 RepID=UPI000BD51E4B|nr:MULTISPECIES: GtrA family protein [unclassified Pseudomonas]PVZ11354.1 putative flippase GtrA [Pseudomonas sp. URIL14HWK12:I12]PVZ22352.1 putative flippase GtrA [Pseudomonas sp. URIL14HWK12:I10]PVZ31524.1 putative flippase GtrA [Pseudomonas sp. URIL14HWK12:I11]SNZ16496.1 Putative flippase GtrA (transmembrane translocase of bactoprenol-linked glucose) [Pseudomonas sp. URIL14HWK12:I9]